MQLNFDYLKNDPLLGDQYESLERLNKLYLIDDYRDVVMNCRLVLETVVKKVFTWENLYRYYDITDGEQRTLRSDINYLEDKLDYPKTIYHLMNELRRMGNDAIHDANYHFTKEQAWHCLCEVNDLFVFFINSYEDEKLNYMRPDVMMAAVDDPKFKKRNLHSAASTSSVKKRNSDYSNAKQAKKVLNQKKKKRFSGLRKLLRH